jgi:hypothetical protein
MSSNGNGDSKVSAELKKIMDSYRRLADQPGGAAGHGTARIEFPTVEAPVTDERDREEIDREFRQVVDRFIHLANEQIETVQREHVSLALLYAAARFNSFIVSTHAPSREKFEQDRPAAFKFFTAEYHRMLEENLDDYQRVHETRTAAGGKPGK